MALSTSNVKDTAVRSYFEGIARVPTPWTNFFAISRDDVAALRLAAMTGIDTTPTWDGSSDLTTQAVDSTGSKTLNYSTFGAQVRIGKYDVKDVPGIVQQAARKLGMSVAKRYDVTAATLLANAFTSATTADGQPLCDTAHTMTSGTRSNKLTTALDRTALVAAIKAARKWQNYQTQKTDMVVGRVYLVVTPDLEEAALQAVQSMYTSDQNQVNILRGFDITVVVWNELSDANDWFLVFPDFANPLHLWERSAPDFMADVDQDNLATKLNVDFAIVASPDPQPDGIIGSSVT